MNDSMAQCSRAADGKEARRLRSRATRSLAIAGLIASVFAAAGCGGEEPPARGSLIESKSVGALPAAAIDAGSLASGVQALSGTAKCDVDVRSVGYATVGPKGEGDVKVVTALLVPSGAACPGPYPLVAYNRGTDVQASRNMANPADSETQLLVAMLASQGYVVVAPNYIGYAGSTFKDHPYLHADSEASTTIDAIRASRAALADSGVALNGRVLLTGYSQGGHASMATQRAIERDFPGEFNVVAAGHMSGPYNLTGSFITGLALLPGGSGGSTIFSPFALTSYQKIYGNLYANASDYFKAPYAAGIDTLFPSSVGVTELFTSGKLPTQLGDLITDKQIADLNDSSSGLRAALAANSLLGWAPKAPMMLCGGKRDPVAFYQNALDAKAAFAAQGIGVVDIDVETIPEFAPLFPQTLSAEQLTAYHGTTVPPLCMKVVRDQLFALKKS